MVNSANSFSKDGRNVQYLQLGAQTTMLVLGNRIGHNDLVNGRCIKTGDCVATEDTVGEQSIDFGCSLLLQELRSSCDGVGSVSQVVNQDANAIGNIANEHHASVSLFSKLNGAAFLKVG